MDQFSSRANASLQPNLVQDFEKEAIISKLKNRVTELEYAHDTLKKNHENLLIAASQNTEKIDALEAEVAALRNENSSLKALAFRIKEEFQKLQNLAGNRLVPIENNTMIREEPMQPNQKEINEFPPKESIKPYISSDNEQSPKEQSPQEISPKTAKLERVYSDILSSSMGNSPEKVSAIQMAFEGIKPGLNYYIVESYVPDLEQASYEGPACDFSFVEEETRYRRKTMVLDSILPPRKKTVVQGNSFGQKSTIKFAPKKLFENFFVIGATKENIKDSLKRSTGDNIARGSLREERTMSFEGKILFNYEETMNLSPKVTPPGIEKLLSSWDLVMCKYDTKSKHAEDYFKKTVLKGQRKYKKRYICPYKPHNNDIIVSKWVDYPESLNPQNLLYALCIQKGDYVIVDDEVTGKEHFVYIETIYCLLTYYSIPELCFNILVSALNLLRKRRKEIFYEHADGNKRKIDFGLLDTLFLQNVTQYLQNLLQVGCPSPNRIIKYEFNDDKFPQPIAREYRCPSIDKAYLELAAWESHQTFSNFSLDELSMILGALLLEQTVVFFSKDITLLTGTLNTFFGLLFPFKYAYSIVPTLTSKMLHLFEFIHPVVICVNRKEEYFWRKRLHDYPHVFVFLDSKIIFINGNNREILRLPSMSFVTEGLENPYGDVNPKTSKFEIVRKSEVLMEKLKTGQQRLTKKKSTFEDINIERQMGKCKAIFLAIRERIEKNILEYLQHFEGDDPLQAKDEDTDDKINKLIEDESIRHFFYAFKKTMIFINYPDTVSLDYRKGINSEHILE